MKGQFRVMEAVCEGKPVKDHGIVARKTVAGMLQMGRLMSDAKVNKLVGIGYTIEWPHNLGMSLIVKVN